MFRQSPKYLGTSQGADSDGHYSSGSAPAAVAPAADPARSTDCGGVMGVPVDENGSDDLHLASFRQMNPAEQREYNFREGQRQRHAIDRLGTKIDSGFDRLAEEIRTPMWKRAVTPVMALGASIAYYINQGGGPRP